MQMRTSPPPPALQSTPCSRGYCSHQTGTKDKTGILCAQTLYIQLNLALRAEKRFEFFFYKLKTEEKKFQQLIPAPSHGTQVRSLRLYVSSSSSLGLYEAILKCDLGPLFLCSDEWSVTRTTNSITCTRKGNNTYNPNKYLEKPLTGNKVAANVNIIAKTKAL